MNGCAGWFPHIDKPSHSRLRPQLTTGLATVHKSRTNLLCHLDLKLWRQILKWHGSSECKSKAMTFNPLFFSSGVPINFMCLHTEYLFTFIRYFTTKVAAHSPSYYKMIAAYRDVLMFCILFLVQSFLSVCSHQPTPSMLVSIFFSACTCLHQHLWGEVENNGNTCHRNTSQCVSHQNVCYCSRTEAGEESTQLEKQLSLRKLHFST